MILERGNMWDMFGKTDLFLVTTNPIVRADGAIVMGRGIALEAKQKYPELPYIFAKEHKRALDIQAYDDALMPTYIGIIGRFDGQGIGWFMTKNHWRESSVLSVIEQSTRELIRWAKLSPDMRFDLNFPGIGNGKLRREDVLPIIEKLPDNVHVWEYGE